MNAKLPAMAVVLAAFAVTPAMAQTTPTEPVPGAANPASASLDPKLVTMTIEDLEDRDLHGSNGDELGEIERVVRGPQGLMAVVETSGEGWFGMGSKSVLVGLDQFRMEGDRLTLTMTEDQARSLKEFEEEDGYAEVEDEEATLGDAMTSVR